MVTIGQRWGNLRTSSTTWPLAVAAAAEATPAPAPPPAPPAAAAPETGVAALRLDVALRELCRLPTLDPLVVRALLLRVEATAAATGAGGGT